MGCPRSGSVNAERLRRKYKYKLAVKDAAMDADRSFSDSLYNNLTQKNHVNFWKTWRRKFCSSNSKPANCVNGQTGDANILNEFTNYFELVGKPNTVLLMLTWPLRMKLSVV